MTNEINKVDHPADDSEPVTEEWLSSVLGTGASRAAHVLAVLDKYCAIGFLGRTRGDVRRLCATLGIDLEQENR